MIDLGTFIEALQLTWVKRFFADSGSQWSTLTEYRVRNLKFATYLKFATCENTNKINEFW